LFQASPPLLFLGLHPCAAAAADLRSTAATRCRVERSLRCDSISCRRSVAAVRNISHLLQLTDAQLQSSTGESTYWRSLYRSARPDNVTTSAHDNANFLTTLDTVTYHGHVENASHQVPQMNPLEMKKIALRTTESFTDKHRSDCSVSRSVRSVKATKNRFLALLNFVP